MPLTTMLDAVKPVVRLTGPIDMQVAYLLIDELDLLKNYYQFRTVVLQIDSPGGDATALHYLVQSLTAWRKGDDRVLETVGLNEICSAAAILLSFGTLGHRTASRHSRLLYHPVRTVFPAGSTQTYTQLKATGKLLDQWDSKFLDLMTEHTQSARTVDNGTYRRKLKRFFLQEKYITAEQACELQLIDRVCEREN